MTASRIAVFLSFSGAGGVERMVTNLLPAFLAAGHAVDLVSVRGRNVPSERLPEGVRIVDLGVEHSNFAAPALARYLRQTRPDALLAAKDRAIRAAVIARALSGTRPRLVGRLGTNLSAALEGAMAIKRWARLLPMRLLYRHVDTVVAVSEGVAADTLKLTGLPPERVRVVRNPVITPELETRSREALAHPWLAAGQPPVILGAGRLTRQKDFPTLVRAFATLRRRRPCRLIILGEGRQRRELEGLATDLGVAEEVWLPGHAPNPYAWMCRASLFALSSAWEGSPNVLTEALALGVPAVATDCPSGPREILAGGHYGPLVPVGDAEGLALAMERLLEAPPDSATLRQAVEEYTVERSAHHYRELLGVVAA